jgi:YNFM family putative membrane transporter
MADASHFRFQAMGFALGCAAFTNIDVTQPVLPVLRAEFATDLVTVSLTVSLVLLGIAPPICPSARSPTASRYSQSC